VRARERRRAREPCARHFPHPAPAPPPGLTDCFAKRLQIQEQLTFQIADAVATHCGARGVAVIVEGTHMCMTMRGVEKPGSVTSTSSFLGAFKGAGAEAVALREEFMQRVLLKR